MCLKREVAEITSRSIPVSREMSWQVQLGKHQTLPGARNSFISV